MLKRLARCILAALVAAMLAISAIIIERNLGPGWVIAYLIVLTALWVLLRYG